MLNIWDISPLSYFFKHPLRCQGVLQLVMKLVRDEWWALTTISLSQNERERGWRGDLHLGCLQNTDKDICSLLVVPEY